MIKNEMLEIENQKINLPQNLESLSKKELINTILKLEDLVETISIGKMVWQKTFDVISDPVMIIDGDYNISRANYALASSVQKDVRNMIGKKCYQVFAGYDKPCPYCPMEITRSDKQHHSGELSPFPNGLQYFVNAYFFKNQSAEAGEVILHYRNITDEKELQNRLMQTDKMAAIGTLAGGIAHEINNPLGAILAFTQLVIRDLEETHNCQKDLKEIEEATLRCKKIVRDLLDFSRQNYDEQMQKIDLNRLIEKTMPLIHIGSKTHSAIHVTFAIYDDLPNVWGHFHKLQQVLLNLITNALFALKETGGELVISTDYDSQTNEVILSVKDNGTGIDKDHLNKIFNPYFTTKEQGEGTGLGLSIIYKIIQEHEAKIAVESEKNQGTEMKIFFPKGK